MPVAFSRLGSHAERLAVSLQAHHDVRASLALFEKSLNIPAVHRTPSPPKAATPGVPAGPSPQRPALAAEPAPQQQQQAQPAAVSIESRGAAAPAAKHDQPRPWSTAGPIAIAAEEARYKPVALPQVPPSMRHTPLAAAMGGLAGLGYGAGGSDRESIWQQELSQELYRVKAGNTGSGGGAVPNQRTSLHGSPLKRPTASMLH
jgi:hypothetical protein